MFLKDPLTALFFNSYFGIGQMAVIVENSAGHKRGGT